MQQAVFHVLHFTSLNTILCGCCPVSHTNTSSTNTTHIDQKKHFLRASTDAHGFAFSGCSFSSGPEPPFTTHQVPSSHSFQTWIPFRLAKVEVLVVSVPVVEAPAWNTQVISHWRCLERRFTRHSNRGAMGGSHAEPWVDTSQNSCGENTDSEDWRSFVRDMCLIGFWKNIDSLHF